MKSKLILGGALCLCAVLSVAQTTPDAPDVSPSSPVATQAASPQADTSPAAQHTSSPPVPAILSKSIDSKKVKSGDPIEAKTSIGLTSGSGVQIPRGTKIIGHIKDAKATSKGDPESSLSFSFEKMVLKNGNEIPFPAVVQAIGAQSNYNPAAAEFPESGGPSGPPTAGGGAAGAATGASSTRTSAAESSSAGTSPASPGASASMPAVSQGSPGGNAPLPANASGVVGIKGLTLSSQAFESTVSSNSKSVKLDQGTQLLLRYSAQ